jgi:diguanylate cyclase (GGDEF)-like protein/PAS domain S-box-containing protein
MLTEGNVMRKPLGEEMEFFRQYNEALFNKLEKKMLIKETAIQHLWMLVQEHRLQFKNISDVVFIIGADFKILSISPSVEELLGYKAKDFIGRPVSDLSHILTPESFERAITNVSTMLKGKKIPATNYHFSAKDGTIKCVEIHGSPFIRDGQVAGTISVVRDMTERKLTEEKLRESEERYRELIQYAPAGIYEYDYETNRFTNVNNVICEYTQYTRDELLTTNFFNILTEDSRELMLTRLEKLMAQEDIPQEVEYCIRKKGGEELWVQLRARYIYESGKLKGSSGIVYNINEQKRAEDLLKENEKKYRELSIIDDLTQLYNSRHFHAQLEIEIERSNRYGQPLTLLLLDLDKFKKFNDKYGHVEGDNVLSKIGQVIKRCLRDPDSAYRYGGEEFTIMLPMTTSEEGIVTAKRIQTELRKEAFSPESDKKINMTVSIGVAQYKQTEEMKTFVQRVDKLMYQAKKDGRDRICPDRVVQKQKSITVST